MSSNKILLIDGYNVINRLASLQPSPDGGLENAREKLDRLVAAWRAAHRGFDCVIVFDGRDEFAGSGPQRLHGVRTVFSRVAHGGDAEIIRFVRDYHGRPSDITVVSDDNHVRNNSRAHGAKVEPASYLKVDERRPAVHRKPHAPARGLDPKAVAEINRELRKKYGL